MIQKPDLPEKSQADKIEHLVNLIMKYKRNCISASEHEELEEWIVDTNANLQLFEDLTDETQMKEAIGWMSNANTARALSKLKGQLHFEPPQRRRFSILGLLLNCAIAASVLLLLTLSLVFIADKE